MKYILGLLCLVSTLLVADTIKISDVTGTYSKYKEIKAEKELKQSLNFGFANTTGNTDTLNINGKYTLAFSTLSFNDKTVKVALDCSLFISENADVRDNEEYKFNLGLEQFITDEWLAYISLNWLRNEFQNYDHKFALGFGLGKELFKSGTHSLIAKMGIAYNIEDYSNVQESAKFTSLNEYLEYNNKFNEVSSLYLKLGAFQNVDDFDDYDVLFVGGFNFQVAENISLSIEEEVRYDKIPPIGFDTTDTKTIIRLGYHF